MDTIEKQAREECQKIRHFFDYSMSKMINIEGVEQVAGVPPGALLNVLTKAETIQNPLVLERVVGALEVIGYQARWDWEYIVKNDFNQEP